MIRTLIVDDQNIIRQGIKALLESSAEIQLIGFAEDGETALKKVEQVKPDVVLLDINLPGINGITVANRISSRFPQVKVIMLSSCEDETYVSQAMASSAKGYLLKNVSAKELEWSIKLVHQGYSAFKSELLASFKQPQPEPRMATTSSSPTQDIKVVSVPKNNFGIPPASRLNDNSGELELLLARNQIRQKYSKFKHRRQNFAFHDVNVSRVKKTMMSFEFRLLIFIILFSLGFLVFVALS